ELHPHLRQYGLRGVCTLQIHDDTSLIAELLTQSRHVIILKLSPSDCSGRSHFSVQQSRDHPTGRSAHTLYLNRWSQAAHRST
ncbi:hypothetical protein PMAYCL1PPCAC_28296, partial [Pristionchus mayeri]